MAPNSGARILFFDFGKLGETRSIFAPPSMYDMMKRSYDYGSRVMTLSYSARTPVYTFSAEEMDRFCREHDDYVVIASAGNSGPGADTVGSPATAKNVIAVGATPNGFGSWPGQRDEYLYSEDHIMSYSSRNVAADGRMKPEVVAPGSNVLSANAGGGYTLKGGTSMSAPVVAALVTRLRVKVGGSPSSALVRGILYHRAVPIEGRDVIIQNGRLVELDMEGVLLGGGYGRVSLVESMLDRTGWMDRERMEEDGAPKVYTFSVPETVGATVTLSWTDREGYWGEPYGRRQLINDIDLMVQVWKPGGDIPDVVALGGGAKLDRLNNHERITFHAQSGDTVRVTVSRSSPFAFGNHQPYALVYSGLREASGSQNCNTWDPEYMCGAGGVRHCNVDGTYGECVSTDGCTLGKAKIDGGVCTCYRHQLCEDDDRVAFWGCDVDTGIISPDCERIVSVFESISDRVRPFTLDKPNIVYHNLVRWEDIVIPLPISLVVGILIGISIRIYIHKIHKKLKVR